MTHNHFMFFFLFFQIVMLKYRMVMAYKVFHSVHNLVDEASLGAHKKKKRI